MGLVEVFLWLLGGILLYKLGSLFLFFKLCLKVAKEMEDDPHNVKLTPAAKELRDIAGDDFLHELHKKVHENE